MESYSICLCVTSSLYLSYVFYIHPCYHIFMKVCMYMYGICMYMLYYLYLLMSVLPNINKASMVGTGYLFKSLMPILEKYNKNYDSCIT